MPAPTVATLIDVVDEADEPVGVVPRGAVFAEHLNFRVVHVFVINSQGRILLQQLGRQRERHALRWGSSVAGYLHAGEPEWAGARRRLLEELGLETPLRKHGSIAMRDEESTKFVTLYLTYSEHALLRAVGHIERIEYRDMAEVEMATELKPREFTPTFLRVFHFYRSTPSET